MKRGWKRWGLLLTALAGLRVMGLSSYWRVWPHLGEKKTIAQRLAQYGDGVRARLGPHFSRAGVRYPPAAVILAAFKEERRLQVYARNPDGKPVFIREYRILAASGKAGPKLREGDRQVPEGIYPIESLNPNSRFHLALRVGSPNRFDREQAQKDGRTELGGDIMIHGSSVSIGCLAMGDEAAEDLFVLAAETGIANITAILSPVDFRQNRSLGTAAGLPSWYELICAQVEARLQELPNP